LADTTITFGLDASRDGSAPEWGLTSEEALLVEGLRAFENSAYEALVDRYSQPVYGLVYRLVSDPADTPDVVQDVFIKVFRSIKSFRGQSSLKTWIYRIAINEAHNQRRWFGRKRSHEVGIEDEQASGMSLHQTLEDTGRSPFQVTLDRETREQIEEALRSLRPVYRTAVILRDIEEFSYEEIAEILQINIGTVKSRILRGREALRSALEEQLFPSAKVALSPQTAA
jgi:RNA polymerase sigma-70 factor, ECF subfamily